MDKTLGENFIPESQGMEVDTIDATPFITLRTIPIDSLVPTSGLSVAVLGRISDDDFGSTTAGFAAQFMPATSYNYADSLTDLDSACLFIGFTSTYGRDKTLMNVGVYELNSPLSADSTYIGSKTLAERRVDLSKNLAVRRAAFGADTAMLWTTLDSAFAGKLWDNRTDTGLFVNHIHGLYITVDEGSGGCIKTTQIVNSSYTSDVLLYLFGHYTQPNDSAGLDTIRHQMVYMPYGRPHFNVISHAFDANAFNSPSTLYMQGLNGMAIELRVDTEGLRAALQAKTGNRFERYAINRAQLVLSVQDNADVERLLRYPTNLRCTTYEHDTAGKMQYYSTNDMFDYSGNLSAIFDGTLNRSQMHYSLNITHYANGLLSGRDTAAMQIVPYSLTAGAEVARIFNSGASKPHFIITYVGVNHPQ